MTQLDAIVMAYLESALWTSADDPEVGTEATVNDIASPCRADARAECLAFLERAGGLPPTLTPERFGCLFWLMRNGFTRWLDTNPGGLVTQLTVQARVAGEVSLYRHTDGLLYFG